MRICSQKIPLRGPRLSLWPCFQGVSMKGPWLSVWPCLQKVAMHVSKNVPSGLISSHPLSLLLWEVNVDQAHRAQLSLQITIRSQILQILNSPDSHTFALVTNRLRTLEVTIL